MRQDDLRQMRFSRVAHTSRCSLPGCMCPCGAGTEKWDICPARDSMLRGAYITTEGVLTYAPPGADGFPGGTHPARVRNLSQGNPRHYPLCRKPIASIRDHGPHSFCWSPLSLETSCCSADLPGAHTGPPNGPPGRAPPATSEHSGRRRAQRQPGSPGHGVLWPAISLGRGHGPSSHSTSHCPAAFPSASLPLLFVSGR